MPHGIHPIAPDELDSLFGRFGERTAQPCALAVSGGSDSTALMVLFADWLAVSGKGPQSHVVLTVDHGLRLQSAVEARATGARAGALGFRHAVLSWEGAKPDTSIQAAARRARYRLMQGYMAARDLATLFTAHTLDDQAETVLMRLARGSGLDGLAAMAPLSELAVAGVAIPATLTVARPLLEVPKARLRVTLECRGIPWIEDPSNQHAGFERTRLRAAGDTLESLGLTADALGLSARRLQRARGALKRWVDDFRAPEAGRVVVDPCGVIAIDAAALRGLPAEIAVRVLSWAVAAAGGAEEPVPLAGVETMSEALPAGAAGAWTLARAKIAASPERIVIEREPGREPAPALTLEPGAKAVWDGRFLVTVGRRLRDAMEVRALGMEGVREARSAVGLPSGVSAAAMRALPGFWRAGRLVAAPNLQFWAEKEACGALEATFLALGNYNSRRSDE